MLTAENFATKIVSGPMVLIESRSDSSKPRISDVMPTIDMMPMTMPSTVSAERILLARSVSHDIARISENNPLRMLFPPQRFDGIERRRARGRVQAERQADEGRDRDAEHHRPRLDNRRQRADHADQLGHAEAEGRARDAAKRR